MGQETSESRRYPFQFARGAIGYSWNTTGRDQIVAASSSPPRSCEQFWLPMRRSTRMTISIGQCGVALMRHLKTPLCTVLERGRVVGFVLDRGVAGFIID